ncbi:unnamed protein product [Dibothriocephalus latus]|uniref:ETS domain-containing protein n=1 Tax=Dibothriocephalus latus TaxID=60516 RepID=A0A3P6TMD9_DIBLA|nr:unnamed protein product [Dibothriocephalus latus]
MDQLDFLVQQPIVSRWNGDTYYDATTHSPLQQLPFERLLHEMPTNDVVKPMDLPTAPVPVNSVDPSLLPCGIPGLDVASMSQLLLAQLCTGMTAPPTTTTTTTAVPLLFPPSADDQQQFTLGLYKLLASSLYWSAFEKLFADSLPLLGSVAPPAAPAPTICSDEDETRADDRPSHASWPISQRHSNPFRLHRSPKRVHRLWQFLWTLLEDPNYNPSIIRWVDKEAKMFELTKSSVVANLWGAQKQKPGMSYENLGRSLRYYYSRKILKKVSGQRLVYQFLPTEALLACEQSQAT